MEWRLTRLMTSALVTALVASAIVSSARAARPPEAILHNFAGTDGSAPDGLASAPDGALYGSTFAGGQAGGGTAFPQLLGSSDKEGPWTLQTLHVFRSPNGETNDGVGPVGNVVRDASGALYGVTVTGGVSAPGGTIYRLDPPSTPVFPWHETILYRFTEANGAPDGDHPQAGLIQRPDGTLLEVPTWAGGRLGAGVVFQLAPPTPGQTSWTKSVLHDFSNTSDGGNPAGTPIPRQSRSLIWNG